MLCLAAGSGLAPILDVTEAALRRGFRNRVGLIVSARTRADAYGVGMFSWWRTKHRKFDYAITFTREQAEEYLHGQIDAILPRLYPDLSGHSVFVAGSRGFVDTCVAKAKELGAREGFIHTEGFFLQQQHADAEGRRA